MEPGEIFSSDEIKQFSLVELHQILDYLGVVYKKSDKIPALAATLSRYQETQKRLAVIDSGLDVVMSERVRRIKDRIDRKEF